MERERFVPVSAEGTFPVTPESRSATSCLLCWKNLVCSGARELGCEDTGASLEFAGARGVKPLEKQLTQWFILRKVLGVSVESCQEIVFREGAGAGAPEGDNQLAEQEWFRVCDECLHSSVREVWFIRRQIESLERRVEEVREQLKKKMRNGATKTNQAREAGEIPSKIRKLLIPEIGEMSKAPLTIQNMTTGSNEPPQEDDHFRLAKDGVGSTSGEQDEREGEAGHEGNSAEVTPSMPATQKMMCVHCELSSANLTEMRRHWKKHREEGTFALKCDKCGKNFSKRSNLFSHQRLQHENVGGRTCPHCQRQFSTVRHMEDHSRFVCSKHPLREKPQRRPSLKTKGCHPKTWFCAECNAAPFNNVEELQGHERLHRERKLSPVVDDAGRSLECAECSFPAGDYQQLVTHFRERHQHWWSKGAQRYECPANPDCSRAPDKWSEVLQHVTSVHSEEVKLQLFQRYLYCDQCSFKGDLPRDLYWHRIKLHEPTEIGDVLKCSKCGVLCTSSEELRSHENIRHLLVNRFVCDVCGKGFATRCGLRQHSVAHSPQRNSRKWVCDVCGVDYTLKASLLSHVRKVHSDKEGAEGGGTGKVHKCHHCNVTSPFRAVIRKHLQTHKAESQWKCDKCGKGYLDKGALGRHHALMHSETQQVVPCPYCHRGFPNRHYVRGHIRTTCRLKRLQDSAVGGNPGESGSLEGTGEAQ